MPVSSLERAPIEGVVVEERGPERLAEAMVESLTEFDFSAWGPSAHPIPDDLRERLVRWCADLQAWDRNRP